jgi:coproporphyrinogen III oxidase
MKIVSFVNETKELVIEKLLEVSGAGNCTRDTIPFDVGHADSAVIRGGAIEKASITHLVLNQVKPPGVNDPLDYMVFQMEVFPENPHCPMGNFNTEWALTGSGPYHMNLDLFPALPQGDTFKGVKTAMDGVAEKFGIDKEEMRKGLDEHYTMEHFDEPLSSNVGCKLLNLKDEQVDLFIEAYHTFFNGYVDVLKSRKDTPYTESDTALKHRRNGKWLEYITLKDVAIKMALNTGIPPEVLVKLSYPPSAVF